MSRLSNISGHLLVLFAGVLVALLVWSQIELLHIDHYNAMHLKQGTQILNDLAHNSTNTTKDIVCVALQLNGGFNGAEGALNKQEFKNAGLPMDYCNGFSLVKK